MKKNKYFLLLIILFISIGFAVLTANLDFTGTFTFKDSKFSIYLDKVEENNSSDKNVNISIEDKTNISLSGTFDKLGDYIEFSFYVINDGTINAVFDNVNFLIEDESLNKYFDFSLRNIDDDPIENGYYFQAGSTKKVTARVEYKYDIDELINVNNLDMIISINFIQPRVGLVETLDYEYNGKEQYFIVPKSGTYKLEAWGAQGGNSTTTYIGGYGAYSFGNIYLDRGSSIFINIGGMGETCSEPMTSCSGGYNGGGNGKSYENVPVNSTAAGGGGATHIATSSGLLTSFGSNRGSILLVAAGGGGGHHTNNTNGGIGGVGGGIKGGNPTGLLWDSAIRDGIIGRVSFPGSQTGRGCNSANADCSGFGFGGSSSMTEYHDGGGSGGGAGFYGGSAANISAGAGGSSFIGNSLLTEKAMYCYKCEESSEVATKTISTTNVSEVATSNYAKKGNGYVRITYISE